MNSTEDKLNVREFLQLSECLPVADVRTPSEYKQGHIPGAVNIPLFSDDERACVGTIYKRQGREKAVLKGLEFVGTKMSRLLKEGIKASGRGRKLMLYCWRGGMRSESMAWLVSRVEIKCNLLEGGYKSYRSHILEHLSQDRKIIIIGGYTGSGKTSILEKLKEKGEQVIDLEGIANHRGSAFGGLGKETQPTSEQFANLLYEEMKDLDPERRLFMEDESRSIGSLFMPDEIFEKIRKSNIIAITPAPGVRIPQLLEEYGGFPHDDLITSVKKIEKRIGSENMAKAIESINTGNIKDAIEIVLNYYDNAYKYGLGKRDQKTIKLLDTDTTDAGVNAGKVIEIADQITW